MTVSASGSPAHEHVFLASNHAENARRTLIVVILTAVMMVGEIIAGVLTGSLIVEQIFAIPGMGRYFVSSISNRDYPMVMAVVVLYAFIIVMVNLIVDILYVFIDPRIENG